MTVINHATLSKVVNSNIQERKNSSAPMNTATEAPRRGNIAKAVRKLNAKKQSGMTNSLFEGGIMNMILNFAKPLLNIFKSFAK